MSMLGLYTPPDYVPPTEDTGSWQGPERRSTHPVDVLSRSLNQLCLEASDRYEIIAHLEALGYNSQAKLARLGEVDHFSLGTKLFERTPKRFAGTVKTKPRVQDRITPLVMLVSLFATIVMSSFDQALTLVPAVIVLVWSQLGSSLLSTAKGELGVESQQQVLSLLMIIGGLALAVDALVMRYGLATADPPLIWFTVAGLLWSNRKQEALVFPAIALLAYGSIFWPGFDKEAVLIAVAGIAVVMSASTIIRPTKASLTWLVGKAWPAFFFLCYGVGQGLLLIALLNEGPVQSQILAGTLLLAGIIALSSPLLTTILNGLMRSLWTEAKPRRFAARARLALLLYIGIYVAPLLAGVGAAYLFGPRDWLYHWFAFALFGLILAIAIMFFTLGKKHIPSILFLCAGLVVALTAVPFLLVASVLAVVLTVLLLWSMERVEQYAIYLI